MGMRARRSTAPQHGLKVPATHTLTSIPDLLRAITVALLWHLTVLCVL